MSGLKHLPIAFPHVSSLLQLYLTPESFIASNSNLKEAFMKLLDMFSAEYICCVCSYTDFQAMAQNNQNYYSPTSNYSNSQI